MKLNKDNFSKAEYEGGILYQYICNDTYFFLHVRGKGSGRQISVFKNSAEDRVDEFKTSDSLEAWAKLEEYLKACEPEQATSGGFNKNDVQNPNVIPLLAIKKQSSGMLDVILFLQVNDGRQVPVMNFQLTPNALTLPASDAIIVKDWSDEEIPNILKCEVLLKKSDIEFQEDTEREVFFFIPKSIVEQGGEKGGQTEPPTDGEPTDGQPTDEPPTDGQPTDEPPTDGQPTDEPPTDGQPTDEPPTDGQPTDEPPTDGQPTDEPPMDEPPLYGKPTNEKIDRTDDDGVEPQPVNFGDVITRLGEITNTQPSTLVNIFDRERVASAWLQENNFSNIKRQLNLPSSISELEFARQIINSK